MKITLPLLLASSALLLASCNNTDVPSDLTNVSGTVVEGNLAALSNGALTLTTSAWTGGAGSVRAYTTGGSQPQNVVNTALAADGKFSLNLPIPAAGTLSAVAADEFNDEEDTCTGTVTVSNSQAQVAFLAIGAEGATKSGGISPLSVKSTVDSAGTVTSQEVTFGGLIYVDRGVTLKGTQNCKSGADTFTSDVNVTLQKGWNKFSFSLQFDANDEDGVLTRFVVRSGSYPDNWVFLNDEMSTASLGSQTLKTLKSRNFPLFR